MNKLLAKQYKPSCGDKSAGLPICTAKPPQVSHRDVANARVGMGGMPARQAPAAPTPHPNRLPQGGKEFKAAAPGAKPDLSSRLGTECSA
jgi:hypothetical protein